MQFSEILKKGKISDLLSKLEVKKFESLIHKKHSLKKVKNNIAEGYVIKPLSDDSLVKQGKSNNYLRYTYKYKNDKFLEIMDENKITLKKIKKKF